ncbi:AraC family transcriptional regulator [Achromobacter insuavis]
MSGLALPDGVSAGLFVAARRPGPAQADRAPDGTAGGGDAAVHPAPQLQRHAGGPRGAVLPRHVRCVQDYLQAHAHEPVSAEQLARIAGVSVRSLYAGFKEFLGISPMHYLRDLRMERARAELVAGECQNVAGWRCAGVSRTWGVSAPATRRATAKAQPERAAARLTRHVRRHG